MAGSDHPNRVLSQKLWESVAVGDASGIREVLAPNIRWQTRNEGDLSGVFEGVDAVLDYMASVGERVDKLRSDLLGIFVNDDGAVIWYTVEANRGAQELRVEHVLVLEIEENRFVRATTVPNDQSQSNSFWTASPPAPNQGGACS